MINLFHFKEPRKYFRGSYGRKKKRRYVVRRRGISWKYALMAGALLIVFFYAAISLAGYVRSSAAVQKTNEALQQVYAAATQSAPAATPTATITPLPAATQIPRPASTSVPGFLRAYQQVNGEILPQMAQLRAQNRDTVAWLAIPGVVDLPVVYRDNTYYLNHDFYGERSKAGTLFLDQAHPIREDTQYLVIHGHNMNDGSMFGLLSHYRSRGYMEKHAKVYLTTLRRQEEYEVVGVLQIPTDVRKTGYVAIAGTRKFQDAGHYYAFTEAVQTQALYWKRGVQLQMDDALLSLSTCYEDERVVVICRRVKQ